MESKKPDVLDDPDAPPTEEERAAAARLRDGLEGAAANDETDLARALSLAYAPRALPDEEHHALIERALDEGEARRRAGRTVIVGPWRRKRAAIAFGVAAALSVAAGVALLLGPVTPTEGARAALTLSVTRTTQPLFDEPFTKVGGESARIDRIASARAADLRENRFARWGVQ